MKDWLQILLINYLSESTKSWRQLNFKPLFRAIDSVDSAEPSGCAEKANKKQLTGLWLPNLLITLSTSTLVTELTS